MTGDGTGRQVIVVARSFLSDFNQSGKTVPWEVIRNGLDEVFLEFASRA
jgi:hypothetical protein